VEKELSVERSSPPELRPESAMGKSEMYITVFHCLRIQACDSLESENTLPNNTNFQFHISSRFQG
jgi:hypothetical protein